MLFIIIILIFPFSGDPILTNGDDVQGTWFRSIADPHGVKRDIM